MPITAEAFKGDLLVSTARSFMPYWTAIIPCAQFAVRPLLRLSLSFSGSRTATNLLSIAAYSPGALHTREAVD
jgi:hypothetical protein